METNVEENSEVTQAAEAAKRGDPGWDVRHWLHQCVQGTLSTINVRRDVEGFPMGSVVPFAVDQQGRPLVLIANIAAHTKNLKSDNRASLFIQDPAQVGDPQGGWRASLLGRFSQLLRPSDLPESQDLPSYAERVNDDEWSELLARYVQRVPEAHSYLKMHGFHLWRMSQIETIRYIAGFGRICWVDGASYFSSVQQRANPAMELGATEHMNEDHAENMREICRGLRQIDPEGVQMEGLDLSGFLIRTKSPNGLHYFPFDLLVETVGDYKTQIIRTLSRARKQAPAVDD
jgi:hypothetical protein